MGPDPLIGRLLGGKFKISKQIGEGGMGAVYVGEQALGQHSRKVAIKTLHSHLSRDEKIRSRFQREVGTLATLEHPNTVQVFDFGTTEDGVLYIVMEFVQGRSIADILEKEGPMKAERVEKILAQICGSLSEAHGKGIIHRDLKPDNIILTERAGQKDFVKVLDFGIAKRSGEEDRNEAKLTQQGMVLGTPPYMSPEQFTGQPLDARSDIYSLAVMAYEMLTGVLPFDAKSAFEWATLHMTAAPKAIEATPNGAALPESMRSAIMRALSKNREQRFATIGEFHDRFAGKAEASPEEVAQKLATSNHRSIPPGASPMRQGTADMGPPPATAAPADQLALAAPPAVAPAAVAAPAPAAAALAPAPIPQSASKLPVAEAAIVSPAVFAGGSEKGKTQIGEPLAFSPDAGGYGLSPAPSPAFNNGPSPPAQAAAPYRAAPAAAAARGYGPAPAAPQASVPAFHGRPAADDGDRPSRGPILGVLGVVAVASIVLVAWGAGAFGTGSSSPTVPPLDLGTAPPPATVTSPEPPPTPVAPTVAPPLGHTVVPPAGPGPKPSVKPPGPTPPGPAPGPAPKPPGPTPPGPAPKPPGPTPPAPPAPVPTPTPTPVPPPTPVPTPVVPPTPTPAPPVSEPAVCARARFARARNNAAAPGLEAQCRSQGGTP